MGPAFLRKYGVASASGTHIRVPMPVFDDPNLFAGNADWTPAAGDVKVSIDGGVEANIGTLPTFVNGAWEFVLTAPELTGKTITVRIHDAAGDEVADQFIVIETFGHASAMYAVDFTSIDIAGKVLGGGSGTITGTGVRAVDGSGNALAPAATAVSSADLTPTRAGYLDKLSVAGTLAHTGNASSFMADVSDLPTNAELDAALAPIQAAIDALTGSAGTGANVVTVTVTDDDETPLQNAVVRLTEGVNSFTATTNVSGVATFALDNATYTLAITKAGYSFTPASRVVDGAEAFEEEMTQIAITPAANPDQTNAHLVTRDGRGNIQGDVTLEFQRVSLPGQPGHSYAGETFTDASDSETGILEVTLTRSTGYRVRRNYQGVTGPWVNFVTGGESTYLIPFYGLGASNPA